MRFGVLGPLRVHTNADEVTISSGRERTLLAVLLLHANRTVPNTQLIEAIWAEQPPPGARNQLQGCVSRLRKRLATTGLVIITEPAGYRANLPPADLDLLEFRRLVAQARTTAAGDHPASVARYRAALDLWRGPALGGTETGPANAATALDEEHVQVQEEHIEAELAAGGTGRLVPQLTELVGQHPHRERLHRALMLALYRADRQADALAAYRHARTILHDELGIEPGPELQRLHQAILNRDPDLDTPPTPTRPASSDPAPVPRELPADVAGFTGRADALQALDELLDRNPPHDPPAPVVISAIAGTAGVGKTALALHWAHQVTDRYPHGQLYLNLRGYATTPPVRPIEALSALLRSLGTPPEQIPTDEAQAAALYRTRLAGRHALVVLDNARSVDQIRPLLPGAPGCLVLVTSRDRLTGLIARDGATRLTLDVLTPEEAQTLLSNLLGPDRAAAEPAAIDELARACAYLPLALRIAAAHLIDRPNSPIGSYVDDLSAGNPLTALEAGDDQETAVGAAIDVSYRTMPPETRRTFRLLGVMPGPDITPTAVAALINATLGETVLCLRQLAGAYLISEHSPGRFGFHDLLRAYARQRAAEEDGAEQQAASERLLRYYLHSADSAVEVLYPDQLRLPVPAAEVDVPSEAFGSRADAVAWQAIERSNLIGAVFQTAEHDPRPFSWLLADRLSRYFYQHRHMADWLAVAEASLSAAERADDLRGQASCHLNLAEAYFRSARHHDAIQHNTSGMKLAQRAGWLEGQASALGKLGMIHRSIGDVTRAVECYSQAIALNQQAGRVGGLAANHGNLAVLYDETGELRQAAEHLVRALDNFRRLGSTVAVAITMNNLADVHHQLGVLGKAQTYANDALVLYREVGDKGGEVRALGLLGEVHGDSGRLREALEHATASGALAAEIDDPVSSALAQNGLGIARLRQNELKEALSHHKRALQLARDANYRIAEATALLGLANVQRRLDSIDSAERAARRSLDLARDLGYQVLEGRSRTCLAEVRLSQGRSDDAHELATDALENHRRTGHRLGEARTLAVVGHIAAATDQPAVARQYWHDALALYAQLDAPPPADLRLQPGQRRSHRVEQPSGGSEWRPTAR